MKQLTSCFALALSLALLPSPGRASLFFSEYVEGSSYNKALEIFNPTTGAVDLADYSIRVYWNGAATPSRTISLSGTLETHEVFVLSHTSFEKADTLADLTSGSLSFTGNDAVELYGLDTTWDVIGQIGFDPGEFWGDENLKTQDMTLIRNPAILTGDPDGSDIFLLTEWTGLGMDDFSNLGSHDINAVPLPPAALLLGSGLLGMLGFSRLRTMPLVPRAKRC